MRLDGTLETTGTPAEIAAAEAHVRGILRFIGEDVKREGLLDTPARVVRALGEHFSGYALDPGQYLAKTFKEVEGYDELVLVSDIELYSHCEHHMVPFVGRAHVAYVPNKRVVGLGKLPRVVETLASRPQLQERLTEEIAEAIEAGLDAQGVLVVLDAVHGCVSARGARQARSSTVTMATRGSLTDAVARAEILALIGSKA